MIFCFILMAKYLQLGVASSIESSIINTQFLDGDGTCFLPDDYAKTYIDLVDVSIDYSSESSRFVNEVLDHFAKTGEVYESFMEIGPGPCQIAIPLSKKFEKTLLIEPNEGFRNFCYTSDNMLEFFPDRFELFTCPPSGQSLIVLSHVLYHVDPLKRRDFLSKAVKCLKPGGLLTVAMVSDSEGQHELVSKYDTGHYSHAGQVRQFLENENGVMTHISHPSPVTYKSSNVSEDFEAMFRLVYFLVVEDAMGRVAYNGITIHESHKLEEDLRKYTWSLQDADGGFTLTMVDEYTFFQKKKYPVDEKEL